MSTLVTKKYLDYFSKSVIILIVNSGGILWTGFKFGKSLRH